MAFADDTGVGKYYIVPTNVGLLVVFGRDDDSRGFERLRDISEALRYEGKRGDRAHVVYVRAAPLLHLRCEYKELSQSM